MEFTADMTDSVRAGRAWLTFAAVAILWGLPYLWIKIVVDEGVHPAFLAWVRIVLGAAVLLWTPARCPDVEKRREAEARAEGDRGRHRTLVRRE